MQIRRSLRSYAIVALVPGVMALPKASYADTVAVNQGPGWTSTERNAFYFGDQGSQMILLSWLNALKQADGTPFLADALARYGYLSPPINSRQSLPIGFSVAETAQGQMVGMTCSACHTREITADGKSYRIDGGPAIVDFQSLLADLDKATLSVLSSDTAFQAFAEAVLGTKTPDPASIAVLKADVTVWSTRYHVLMSGSLPKDHPWGPSRLDAVGMIFNRLTGLDIGPKPTYLIPSNIRLADAPTRYPFLWNSPVQSMTQWPGFAQNGSDLYALSRNLGEVFGVFGTFHPEKADFFLDPINRKYNADNSANYPGLQKLELLVRRIGAPVWPWTYDAALAKKGEAVFNRTDDQGCVACHGQSPGPDRIGVDPLINHTWNTPVQDAGTDTRESESLARTADAGSLTGASIPFLVPALCKNDYAFNILATSVLGGILQYYAPVVLAAVPPSQFDTMATISPEPGLSGAPANKPFGQIGTSLQITKLSPQQFLNLRGAFGKPSETACAPPPASHKYESRVLYGIWAAAPYLHNGSVPTLAELLKPAAQRVTSFKIGPAYDTVNVGLAAQQTKFDYTLKTTGCERVDSGDSNCGHEYGTRLSDADKKALLEYLKVIKP